MNDIPTQLSGNQPQRELANQPIDQPIGQPTNLPTRPGRKPEWLRQKVRMNPETREMIQLLRRFQLNSVCEEAKCPNRSECFERRTATFMILGANCTRNCTFCTVTKGKVSPVDPEEPQRVAEAVRELGLKHVVITSVTRDDLPDGGAEHFAQVIRAIRAGSVGASTAGDGSVGTSSTGDRSKETGARSTGDGSTGDGSTETGEVPIIEVLIPDFRGDGAALAKVIEAKPDIINHNIETVPRLYPEVRPRAVYERSLELISRVKAMAPSIYTKSGLMVGLGEEPEEVLATLRDLCSAGCDLLTIGQYLAPSEKHHPVIEYITPEAFRSYEKEGLAMGFLMVSAGPLVRSSYMAGETFNRIKA